MGKSDGGPMGCQAICEVLNTGARAKPSAGSVNAAAATAPAPFAAPTMNRRRVTVSPSYAPGMLRSAVYLESLGLRRLGTSGGSTAGHLIEQGWTGYRQQRGNGHEPAAPTRQSLRGPVAVAVPAPGLRVPSDPVRRL